MNSLLNILADREATQEETRRDAWRIRQRLLAPLDAPPTSSYRPERNETEFNGRITPASKSGEYKRVACLAMLYQGRVKLDNATPSKALPETVKDDTGEYADNRKCRDKVTSPLFMAGANKVDEFIRREAIGYVTKRLLYHQGYSRGHEDKQAGKVSSSSHGAMATIKGKKSFLQGGTYLASQVEDVCQEAFVIFWEQKGKGKFVTTRIACRFALTEFKRQLQRHKRATLAYLNANACDDKRHNGETMDAPPVKDVLGTDKVTQDLLAVVKHIGSAKVTDIAAELCCHRDTVYVNLSKARKAIA